MTRKAEIRRLYILFLFLGVDVVIAGDMQERKCLKQKKEKNKSKKKENKNSTKRQEYEQGRTNAYLEEWVLIIESFSVFIKQIDY